MQIVIDSNRMHSEELRAFLLLSSGNKAVIPDYMAMESFHLGTPASIGESWAVLKDFPTQILVLKGNWDACLVDPCTVSFTDGFIDKEQTAGFRDFPSILARAKAGDGNIQSQLSERIKIADDYATRILRKAENMKVDIAAFSSAFTKDEIRRMRLKETWKQTTAEKFFEIVFRLTERSFDAHPDKPKWPHHEHVFNHFLYRHSLAHCVYLMWLVSQGRVQRKATNARNDAIDIVAATFATYFNGFMSNDDQASCIHHRTRFLLKQQGAFLPEDYLDRYVINIADFLDNAYRTGG